MDKSAIEQIQLAKTIEAANVLIDAMPDSIRPVIALPSNFELHDFESKMQQRYRFRGAYNTKSLSAFGEYAESNNTGESQAVFIDADKMAARLILNLGDQLNPGHCDHTASITLEKTAAYKALLEIINRPKDQRETSEFIEDWRAFLTAYGQEDENGTAAQVSIVKALQAVRSITIEAVSKSDSEVRTFGATTSGMDSIDAKSKYDLPGVFEFTCQPYHELPERTFTLRPSILTNGKTPQLVLRVIREQEHNEQMAEQFKGLIEAELLCKSPDVKTYIGTFAV